MQVDTIAQSHYAAQQRISDCTITYNGSFCVCTCVCLSVCESNISLANCMGVPASVCACVCLSVCIVYGKEFLLVIPLRKAAVDIYVMPFVVSVCARTSCHNCSRLVSVIFTFEVQPVLGSCVCLCVFYLLFYARFVFLLPLCAQKAATN